jgi:hypothetical protein
MIKNGESASLQAAPKIKNMCPEAGIQQQITSLRDS